MTNRFLIVLLLLLTAGSVPAHEGHTLPDGAILEGSLPAAESAVAFRPIGELRVWQFFSKRTTFGRLTSAVVGRTEIDGREALVLQEDLEIDYSKIGADRQVLTGGQCYISTSGRYLGSSLSIGEVEAPDRFEVSRKGQVLEGYFTRAGTEQSISTPYERDYYFWDLNFVDQLEYFLAMQDLEVGAQFDDSIYLPQSLMKARIAGQVHYFIYEEIYRNKFDSVFVISLTEPSQCELYLTPDHRLVKVDLVDLDIRVYQDFVGMTSVTPPEATRPDFSVSALLFKLPHYIAFTIIAGIGALLFSVAAFRWKLSYLFLGCGVALYVVVPLVVTPLVVWVIDIWLRPAATGSDWFLLYGAVPPFMMALAQIGLVSAALYALFRWKKPREYRNAGLGAFLGAGFALAEAAYISGLTPSVLFDWTLAERAGYMVIQVTSGALIGRALAGDSVRFSLVAPAALLANAFARFLPLFVQRELVDLETLHFVLIFWVLAYLLLAMVVLKRVSTKKTGRSVVRAEIE